MTANKCIQRLLRLKGLKVVDFTFKGTRKLAILVTAHKNGCQCPKCGRRCKIVQTLPEVRSWRDIPVAGWEVWLQHCPREVLCPTHGRIQEEIPWAREYARVTYRFEYLMLRYCQMMPQKDAGTLLHTPSSTLSDLLHRCITATRDGHKVRGLKRIGIDEISYAKGHKYATLVYDLDRSCIVWVGPGKGRATIDVFFNEVLSDYQKKQIQWASCDMSAAYIGAITDHCLNATLVLDRFHVVKALNAAVDEVRKEQWRLASREERKALKGLRWLLYRHSSTRSRKDTQSLRALDKANRRIYRAWQLKDEFEHFWNYAYRGAAETFLKRWTTAALRSRIPSLRKFVNTLRNHFDNILAFIDRNLTNAVGEGLNRIIKIVKNRASGYRGLDNFTHMIYLTVGDLDIPAQIPSNLRTL